MKLTKKSETSSKITFTYDKPPGAVEGYLYYADNVRVSRTFNPNDLEVTFGKVASGEYAVEAIGFNVIDRAEWPSTTPPLPVYGAKLPALFDPNRPVIRPQIPAGQGYVASGLQDQIVDLSGIQIRGAHDGVKLTGCRNVWVRYANISGARNQGILMVNCENVAFTDYRIADNNPDQSLPDWPKLSHGGYIASSRRIVLGNGKLVNQRTGYGVQVFPNSDEVYAVGLDYNTPGDLGGPHAGVPFLWGEGSTDGVLANSIARDSRFQMAAGGAGSPVPAARLTFCAELNRMGTSPDFQPGAIIGSPGNDPSIVGDPGYRVPWDTRVSGIGAF